MQFKKIVLIIVTLAVLISLCACAKKGPLANAEVVREHEQYDILRQDGKLYLEVHSKALNSSQGALSAAAYYPEFADFQDMVQKMPEYVFSTYELATIRHEAEMNGGVFEIRDLKTFPEPILGSDVQQKSCTWYGLYYAVSFEYKNPNADPHRKTTGYICLQTSDAHQRMTSKFDNLFKEVPVNCGEQYREYWQGTDPDRDADILCYRTLIGSTATIELYSFTEGNRTFYIKESWSGLSPYLLSLPEFAGRGSGDLDNLTVLVADDGEYFYYLVRNIHDRPSKEWITSFGLRPYLETETE